MRREFLVWAVDALVTGLLCLVLVSGLLISSLMIECIPAGGNPQIEFIGQDPCRHVAWATPLQEPESGVARRIDSVDPCLDLPLNRPGFEQGFNLPVPNRSADRLCAVPSVDRIQVPQAPACFKLAREPVPVANAAGCLALSLRI